MSRLISPASCFSRAVVLCAGFFLIAAPARAADDPRRDLNISLQTDKKEYFLGENVVVHYVIRNRGKRTFHVNESKGPLRLDLGGDTRNSAGRATRFKVELLDSQGRNAIDPYPNPMCFGGTAGMMALQQNGEFCESLPLMRYREPAAGTYTIRVYHDLGWGRPEEQTNVESGIPQGPRQAPIATTSIRFVAPTAEQARQVVEAMLRLPEDDNHTWGQRRGAFADFETLRYPVYLPIARRLADSGDARGLEAIGAMAFPEATEALLDLTANKNPKIAAKAGELLLERVPPRPPFDEQPSHDKYLADRSWRKDLQERCVSLAWKWLAQGDCHAQIRGAETLEQFGGKNDLATLIPVMDKWLAFYRDDDVEQRTYLRPRTVCGALHKAACQLIQRGARPPASPQTPGDAVVFLAGLKTDLQFRPDGWQTTLQSLLKHDISFIRAVAVESTPLPLTDAIAEIIAIRLLDESDYVQGVACDLAKEARLARFRRPLLEVLRRTSNKWVIDGSGRAALACGVQRDRVLEILADRLRSQQADRYHVLGLMIEIAVQHEGGYGRDSNNLAAWGDFWPRVSDAWLKFIESNRQALRDGQRFKIAEAPLVPEMFPPKFWFLRIDRPVWPPESKAPGAVPASR